VKPEIEEVEGEDDKVELEDAVEVGFEVLDGIGVDVTELAAWLEEIEEADEVENDEMVLLVVRAVAVVLAVDFLVAAVFDDTVALDVPTNNRAPLALLYTTLPTELFNSQIFPLRDTATHSSLREQALMHASSEMAATAPILPPLCSIPHFSRRGFC
jgi:hypothetical protein